MRICTKCQVEQTLDNFYYKQDQTLHSTICKECSRKRGRAYYHNVSANDPVFIEQRKQYDKEYRTKQKHQVFDHYGRVCVCCGENRIEFLQIDHIRDDGNQHRRAINRKTIYQWLVFNDYPQEFQILCANCNQAKRFGVCPHKQVNVEAA